jgi:hypothetical protein
MDIDKLKNDYQKIRGSKMDISLENTAQMNDFIKQIKSQDRSDEKYLLHNQIFPLLAGLSILIVLALINPIKTVLLLTGMLLIFSALIVTLILRFIDYRNISEESYDLSLAAFLKQKEKRLKSWRATPSYYKWIFIGFVMGLIFMVLGNTTMIRDIGLEYIILSIVIYLIVFTLAWTTGEYFFRKRHEQKHKPLISIISEQLRELEQEDNHAE